MSLTIRLDWSSVAPDSWREDFFWGAWHPRRRLVVTRPEPPASVSLASVSGDHWCLLSNTTPEGAGLVHAPAAAGTAGAPLDRTMNATSDRLPNRGLGAVAFRGYLLDPPLHSWSASPAALRYWSGDLDRRHNGVFAAVCIDTTGERLEFVTDAFGISPLYWRRESDGLVLFASSARLLRTAGDTIEPFAARMMMSRGALCGDASLVRGVRRSPPATVVTFGPDDVRESRWFDITSLPPGEEPLGSEGLKEAEEVFRQSMRRCVSLMPGETSQLDLSGGDDSRRMLAMLLELGAPFHARTMRSFHAGGLDLDARFAAELSTKFGFPHQVLELADPVTYARDDALFRSLVSSEVGEHSWFFPLIRQLIGKPALVFDGLAGDTPGGSPG
jgi:hypothetical protein